MSVEQRLGRRAKKLASLARITEFARWRRPLFGWPSWLQRYGIENAAAFMNKQLPGFHVIASVDQSLSMKEPFYDGIVVIRQPLNDTNLNTTPRNP